MGDPGQCLCHLCLDRQSYRLRIDSNESVTVLMELTDDLGRLAGGGIELPPIPLDVLYIISPADST